MTVVLVIAVPFERLVAATSGVTLVVFLAVNAALWRLHRTRPRTDLAIAVPRWVPIAGFASCLALLAAGLL